MKNKQVSRGIAKKKTKRVYFSIGIYEDFSNLPFHQRTLHWVLMIAALFTTFLAGSEPFQL